MVSCDSLNSDSGEQMRYRVTTPFPIYTISDRPQYIRAVGQDCAAAGNDYIINL